MAADVIRITGLNVDCVVGVYPHERDTSQPLQIDVELRLDTEAAAVRERIAQTVDYAALAAQLRFLLQSCKFQMLETAAHALMRYLLAPPAPGEGRAQVESAKLTLTKANALGGNGVASLEIERDRSWVVLRHEEKDFGTVDVIHETREAGIYRLNVAPGRSIPLHVHRRMQESEMVITAGLLCQGRPAPLFSVRRWPHGAPHVYDNPTERTQTILCVDLPPFVPEDEVPVAGGALPGASG